MTAKPDVPRLNPDDPESWPSCSCGEPSAHLHLVRGPGCNTKGEARIGDYSGVGSTRFSRYIVLCDGCQGMALELDAHIALVESIRARARPTFREEAHDES